LLTSLKDNDGRIIAYCEWRLVGPSGQEVPSGEYVWVNDCWVHKEFRMTGRIERIIDEILRSVPQARYCYFQRKNVSEKVHIYTREQFERRRMAYCKLVKGDF
jgi:hypothetical protein